MWELDGTKQALHNECQEAERLKECLSAAKVALGTTDEEATVARAMVEMAQAELVGKLASPF